MSIEQEIVDNANRLAADFYMMHGCPVHDSYTGEDDDVAKGHDQIG